jgi:PAS domain S-box-containing protein
LWWRRRRISSGITGITAKQEIFIRGRTNHHSMKCIIREEWTRPPVKIGVLALLTFILVLLTIFCLVNNTQIVFTHVYYIPIILAAFWFARKGVLYAIALALFYLWAVLAFSSPDLHMLLAAIARALFFIGISLVIAILSIVITRQNADIADSEARYRGIWESIQAGVILVDADTHTILAANPEAERLTGFTEIEMSGKVCHSFICPAESGKCPISDLGQKVDHAERVLLARGGRQVRVYKTVSDVTIGGRRCFIENFVEIQRPGGP